MASPSSTGGRPPWTLVYGLFGLIVTQWFLFATLINQDKKCDCPQQALPVPRPKSRPQMLEPKKEEAIIEPPKPVAGVAVTVLFRAPKWFHLRYLFMLQNMLVNLPTGWKMQVFTNQKWLESQVLSWHPGLQRFLSSEKVIVTPLPDRLTARGQQPKRVMVDSWFWKSLVADRVLLFSGNGAVCGNHNTKAFQRLAHLDYVGAPDHGRPGGKGEFSFRSRTAMLEVLAYANHTGQELKGGESEFFLNLMQEMNDKKLANFAIARREDTHILGSTTGLVNETHAVRIPLVVAGTQTTLGYADRDSLLKHCPELKVIFPSLHEPACFGAHPKPEPCRASICALGEIPSHGC